MKRHIVIYWGCLALASAAVIVLAATGRRGWR